VGRAQACWNTTRTLHAQVQQKAGLALRPVVVQKQVGVVVAREGGDGHLDVELGIFVFTVVRRFAPVVQL